MTLTIDVAIVGAGAAGLAAGRLLVDAGFEIAILEARDRIGGRVFTMRDPAVPLPIELGAEFVHGSAEQTRALIRDARLSLCEAAGQRWRSTSTSLEPFDDFWESLDRVMKKLDDAREPDRSFAAFLATKPGGRSLARERKLAEQWVRGFHGASPELASERALADGGSPGDDEDEQRQSRVLDGYDRVLSHLARGFESAIRLCTRVTRIAWSDDGVELTVDDGRTLNARAVIVTVPIGVLQSSPGLHGSIEFVPDLPKAKQRAIQLLAMSPVVRATLTLDKRFWVEQPPAAAKGESMANLNFLHAADGSMPVCWTAQPIEAPTLVAWMGGPEAAAIATESRTVQQAHLIAGVARQFHMTARRLERHVQSIHMHDWTNDPYARGAYSYATVGGFNAGRTLAKPAGSVYFAGEAVGPAGESGTVESALISGGRAAKAIGHALL